MTEKICISNLCCDLRAKKKGVVYSTYSKAPKLVKPETKKCPDCGGPLSERKKITQRVKK